MQVGSELVEPLKWIQQLSHQQRLFRLSDTQQDPQQRLFRFIDEGFTLVDLAAFFSILILKSGFMKQFHHFDTDY